MIKRSLYQFALPLFLLTACTSCARTISSDVYTASHVGEASATYAGVIKSIRMVHVQEGDRLQDNAAGMVIGGAAGGVIGNAIGRGNVAPTVLGAVAGAVAGTFAEQKLTSQNAAEYIVELHDGAMLTVVQEPSDLQVGQPVYVMIGGSGRSRVMPR